MENKNVVSHTPKPKRKLSKDNASFNSGILLSSTPASSAVTTSVEDKHAPVVTKRIKNKYQPEWFTDEICKSAHQRDYYHKNKDTDNYKKYRNLTNTLIRSSKSKYFMEAINNDKNCKTLWRHLKDLNSTTGHDIDMITYEDKNLTDKIDIVNCLNDHFSSVGEKLIPHPHSNFESEKINNYVKSKINDNTLFSLYTVTNADVFKYLSNLNINKSTGTDGVGPRILKVSKSIIVDSLTHVINLSLCTGIFPDILKYAKVTPIIKAVFKGSVPLEAQFYPKALDCFEDIENQCIKKMEAKSFNLYMRQFKDTLIQKGRRDFLDEIVTENLSLITKLESEESDVSVEEGKKFTEDEEEDKPKTEETPADDDAEDMMDVNIILIGERSSERMWCDLRSRIKQYWMGGWVVVLLHLEQWQFYNLGSSGRGRRMDSTMQEQCKAACLFGEE
ncbi:ATP-dependent DNA helicase 2 subunit 2 [Mytilus galloprovincialis]|uniref:ATP-dependent DNA helicase 2 subunit 2 n=1 Tax=Mytilus galloprovincialis TaxID=29158 RepID=A0A8B6EAE8_MYTGA|nr:ATP-dependent DNA helicase 2 subunit 2 [Mytilus galloprovincialis]